MRYVAELSGLRITGLWSLSKFRLASRLGSQSIGKTKLGSFGLQPGLPEVANSAGSSPDPGSPANLPISDKHPKRATTGSLALPVGWRAKLRGFDVG